MDTMFAVYDDETPIGSADEELIGGGIYEVCYGSKEEALAAATSEWNSMTDYDRLVCNEFYVGLFEIDEDGLCVRCIEVIKRFK